MRDPNETTRRITNRVIVLFLLILACWLVYAVADARPADRGTCSPECVERVKARERAELHRRHERALAREMRRYKAHPMPACTWQDESGDASVPPFALSRYRALNRESWAGGKFQFIPSTWANIGGQRYARYAHQARPVYQERMARRLAKHGIAVHWVNC